MMKKIGIVFQFFLTIGILAACSASKEARTYKRSINGNWQLETVVSEGIMGKIKVQLFNEADFNCFIGSTWNFNAHNSLGSYSVSKNGDECAAIKRNFRWSIYDEKDQPKLFQFKRLNEKLQEIDENSGGFKFTILQVDNKNMKLKSDIIFEGREASFTYNFIKN